MPVVVTVAFTKQRVHLAPTVHDSRITLIFRKNEVSFVSIFPAKQAKFLFELVAHESPEESTWFQEKASVNTDRMAHIAREINNIHGS
jgi:hypothetical protein